MAKSWEEIKKQRGYESPEDKLINKVMQTRTTRPIKTYDSEKEIKSAPYKQNFNNQTSVKKTWNDIKKDRGYIEPEPTFKPKDHWKENPIKTAAYNVNAGINTLDRGVTGVVDATLGGFGIKPIDNYVQRKRDYYNYEDAKLAEINKGHEILGGVAQGIGQGVYTLPLALLNPAAAGSAMTTAGGTQLASSAAMVGNPTNLNAAIQVVNNLKSNQTLYSSMVTSVGNQYLQGLNDGATREQAINSAIIGGVPSAIIEVSGGLENITGILANKTKGLAGKALQSALEEGLEEIIQYPIENMGQKIAYDKDMPYFSMDQQAVINPKDMAYSGIIGGTVGGLMGGGAVGVNNLMNKKYSKVINEEYNKIINTLPEDSPIIQRIEEIKENNANINDETKLWVINSARKNTENFSSEVDRLNAINQNENTFAKQTLNEPTNIATNNKIMAQNNNVVQEDTNKPINTQINRNNAIQAPTPRIFNIENMNNPKEVKQKVYEFYKNSIISTSENSKPILNKTSGNEIEISRQTINQTFQADAKFIKATDNEIKLSAMENIVDLIQDGNFEIVNQSKQPSSKTIYAEVKGIVNVNNIPYEVKLDVRRTDNGKKLFVHSVKTNIANNESSIVPTGFESRLPKQDYTILNKIGQATGTKIKIIPTIYDPTGTRQGFANGQYNPGTNTLEIALDADNPYLVVAKHEITHMLQQQSPELYQEYKDYVINSLKENGTYENIYNRMESLAERSNINLSKSEVEDEIVSDATELFLTDEQAINQLASENPTLGNKILDILRDFIKKIGEQLKGFTANWMQVNQLREAERLWVNALNDVAQNSKLVKVKETSTENSKVASYSLNDRKIDKITDEVIGYGSGQTDLIMSAIVNDKVAGTIEYSEYKGKPYIKMIQVNKEFQRQGIATKLLQDLQRKYPKTEIDWGYTTPDGTALKEKATITKKNGVYTRIKNEYLKNIESLKEIEKMLDDGDDSRGDEWNKIYDRQRVLEERLQEIQPVTTWIKFSLKDSEGNRLTQEQAEYFKDSKVRDDKGNLLVVYHGTDRKFTKFAPNYAPGWGTGVYLTDNIKDAKEYGENLIKAYVNIKNPYIDGVTKNPNIESTIAYKEYIEKLAKREDMSVDEYSEEYRLPDWDELYDADGDINVINEAIRELGFDGFIAKNSNNIKGYEIVAFNPEQIKSVDNLNPTKDKDIRFSLKEMDKKYLEAVEKDDMETAQKMVTEYAAEKGYTVNDDYRMQHQAPTNDGYNAPLHDITKIYPKDIFSSNGVRYYGDGESYDYESMRAIERAKDKPNRPIRAYRAVPKDVKEERFRVGDWVTLSSVYAKEHGKRHINVPYKVISYVTEAKNLWTDGNSINEFGFDDGKTYAYQNTKNNLKLLDTVTYDENGKVIPLSKRFNKREYDVKYQLKDTTDDKQIERLKRTNERLKEQFKLTKGIRLDKDSIKRLSRTILKDYNSKYSKEDLEGRLNILYNQIANDTIDYEEMSAEIKSISRDIIESASELNDNMYKEYTTLRQTLRNTPITLSERFRKDLDSVGGYNEFRKKNFGKLNLVNDGMDIDKVYQELAEQHPELFNLEITNQADQLMLIEDVLNGLVPIYENPFNRDMNGAVESLALEIFDDFISIPEAKPTYADKQKNKLDKVKQENKSKIKELRNNQKEDIAFIKYNNKEKIKEIVATEKVKRNDAVAKVKKEYANDAYTTWWKNKLKENDLKSHYQEMVKDLRFKKNEQLEKQASKYKERISGIYEDRKIREVKQSIGRKSKRLDKTLRKPTEKQHIPEQLKKSIAELLSLLDFTTDRQQQNTILKLRDLKAEYENIAKTSDEDGIATIADEYIIDALEFLNGKRIADMNLQELEFLNNVVGYFENMVKGYNKAFLNGKWVNISDKSTAILNELKTDNPQNESTKDLVNNFKNMMNWGMLTPQMYFERMGPTFENLYADFRTALDKKILNTKVSQDYMINLLKGTDIKTWTGNKAELKTFVLTNGTSIELNPSQVMSLHLLYKREQARGHILGLGIKAAPIVYKDSKGKKRIKKQFEPVKVTPEDINKITKSLTKEQKRIAEGISKFLNTTSKQWINDAQLKVYGYKTANEENYFPIKTDRNFLKSEFDNNNLDPSFKSMGFLKSTVKGAGNPIIIEDIFDVFTQHADKTSTYNAFIEITETTRKIINYKTPGESIKQAINKKYGVQGFGYLQKLMIDLQGGLRTEGGPEIVNKLIRNTKRTVLGLNLRTIVQQPTAIIRASALIDPKYLVLGVKEKSNINEMLEYSPIALWKSWGYFNLDTGRTMKDIILGTTPLLDMQYIPIQKADDYTWTKIWNAVKLEIKDTTDLKVGSKEYFNAVSERFAEIIDKTQVVDTVLHRSDLMRQQDSGWKAATSFMAEPTKSYNLLLIAKEKYFNDKTLDNKNAMIRTYSAYAATTIVNTLLISLIDKWRNDDEETFINKWGDNVLNEITGMVPLVRDLYSIFQGYSIKRMEYNGFEKIARSMNRTGKYVLETFNNEKHKYPLRLIFKDWIESTAYIFGVSAANVNREIEALMRNYIKFTGNDKGVTNDIYEFMFKK